MIRYQTPGAFKQALDARLKADAASHFELRRLRQLVVFERFLARVTQVAGDAVTLKGGLVLEMRLSVVRATKDVDLRMVGAPDRVLGVLRAAGRLSMGDFMRFEVKPDTRHPTITGDGAVYEGRRFQAKCLLAEKPFGDPFGVDVAHGDPLIGGPDVMLTPSALAFAGIEPSPLRLYPVVTHLAEKLHAYTLPRTRPNSRVKDLPDIALLGLTGPIMLASLRTAIERTFAHRATHAPPANLPNPPVVWAPIYAQIAEKNRLTWQTLDEVFDAARAVMNHPLSGEDGYESWDPEGWCWRQALAR